MPVQQRNRSQSDPFSDPTLPAVPYKSAPPVPPKAAPKRPTHQRDNTMEALKDTVTVKNTERTRMGRSQTSTQVPQQTGRHTTHRSLSQDSASKVATDKSKKPRSKKGSSHADVIDRLDYSGVGGPMFHHDGPFDACAPSRNKHRTKAPMAAWSADGQPLPANAPAAQQEYRAPARSQAQTYMSEPAPKRKVDAIAEAWGIHEPEPFEDFSAGGGQTTDYRYSPSNTISKRSNHAEESSQITRRQPPRKTTLPPPQPIFVPEPDEDASGPPSPPIAGSPGIKRSKSLMQRIRKMRETPNVPVGNGESPIDEYPASPPSPNEAVNGNSTRPTHRSQNSFLGRFGRPGTGNGREYPGSPHENERYVSVDDRKDKELPKPPLGSSGASSVENGVDYFDTNHGSYGASPSGGGGLGRKRSLLQRVGKAVTGK